MNSRKKMTFKERGKKFYIRWGCVAIGVILLLTFGLITAFKGNAEILNYINNIQIEGVSNDPNVKIAFNQQENCYEIDNQTNRELKILQITDTHLGCGFMTITADRVMVDRLIQAVENNKPDLIIVTGDLISPNYLLSGTADSYTQIRVFIALMEKIGVPWAVVFGNHDGEGLASREYFASTIEGAENCLFRKGESDISGEGNYHIKILNNGQLDSLLFLMDTNAGNFLSGYGGIQLDQIAWYEKTIKHYQTLKPDIKSLLFVHIPLPEYKIFWEEAEKSNGDYQKLYGICEESISVGEQFGFYDKIVELNSTKWIFCGHDHKNNFSVLDVNNDVRLTFGLSMDHSAYFFAMGNGKYRGVTVIELGDNCSVNYAPAFEKDNFICN